MKFFHPQVIWVLYKRMDATGDNHIERESVISRFYLDI